ncbi:hypothetical protein KW805_01020 [Candidatus Pacearchaeota archaeon]|nr:hypothetical protein [Candidatus Pacearchaeota archaeon]
MTQSRLYIKVMEAEEANKLFRGASDITSGRVAHIDNGSKMVEILQESMIHVIGDDGNNYTGMAQRFNEPEPMIKGRNKVQLGFSFGPSQSYDSLDRKLLSYGFQLREN